MLWIFVDLFQVSFLMEALVFAGYCVFSVHGLEDAFLLAANRAIIIENFQNVVLQALQALLDSEFIIQ